MAVLWRNVRIQEFKLDRLKEIAETDSDWEAVDEAINRVLFTEEVHRMTHGDGEADEPDLADEDESGLPWDA